MSHPVTLKEFFDGLTHVIAGIDLGDVFGVGIAGGCGGVDGVHGGGAEQRSVFQGLARNWCEGASGAEAMGS
jgi:hypothetical protein